MTVANASPAHIKVLMHLCRAVSGRIGAVVGVLVGTNPGVAGFHRGVAGTRPLGPCDLIRGQWLWRRDDRGLREAAIAEGQFS